MRKKVKLRLLWCVVCFAVSIEVFPRKVNVDSVLNVLDACVADRAVYERDFVQRMDSLRAEADFCVDRRRALRIWTEVARTEFYHSSSRTLEAVREGLDLANALNDGEAVCMLTCVRANVYGNLGLPWEGEKLLFAMDLRERSENMRSFCILTWNDICGFYQQGDLPGEITDRKLREIAAVQDSVGRFLGNSAERATHLNYSSTNIQEMIQVLESHMDTVPDERKSVVAAVLANKYQLARNIPLRDYYWAVASIYSIRTVRYEYEPLNRLAARLYETGDTERAMAYSRAAYEMANVYGTNLRKAEVAPSLLKGMLHEQTERQKLLAVRNMSWLLGAGVVCALLLIIYLQQRRYNRMRDRMHCITACEREKAGLVEELKADVGVKNEYLTRYLAMGLDAVFEIEQLRRIVRMRIQTGDAEPLQRLLKKDGRFDEFQKEYLKRFELSFLRLYPDFVNRINRLFKPEEQIVLPNTEIFNNELRIAAFMKIGITDGPRIATILGVSVYTIYFYRNRLKGRAVNREILESDIIAL